MVALFIWLVAISLVQFVFFCRYVKLADVLVTWLFNCSSEECGAKTGKYVPVRRLVEPATALLCKRKAVLGKTIKVADPVVVSKKMKFLGPLVFFSLGE